MVFLADESGDGIEFPNLSDLLSKKFQFNASSVRHFILCVRFDILSTGNGFISSADNSDCQRVEQEIY